MTRRLIIGISGASGFQYGYKALQILQNLPDIETHLVVSKGADMTRALETPYSKEEVMAMADVAHPIGNLGAAISSGSFRTMGMIVAPCSVRSMSDIAHGVTSGLISRAADVCLKERRRLVLLLRETPLHAGHLKSMLAVTEMGGIIAPPVPAFYPRPQSLDDLVTHTIGRVLDLFDLDLKAFPRWGEDGDVPTEGASPLTAELERFPAKLKPVRR